MSERIEIKAQIAADDVGVVSGIAWPFSPDSVGDVIEKGAFSFPAALPICMEHDQGQVVGTWENFAETDRGLEVEGRLFVEGISPAEKARRHLKAGVITGLSIGFRHDGFETRADGGRTFKAVTVTEISLCKRPVHPAARVTEVKAIPQNLKETPKVENEEIETEEKAVTPANDTPQVPQVDTKAFNEIKDRLNRLEAKGNRPRITGPATPVMGGDEVKAFTDYLRTGDAAEVKSLSYGSGTGGILAPETFSKTILEKIAEFSPVRSVAQTIQMNGPLLQLPRLVNEVVPSEVAEGAAKAESEPSFEQIDVKPFEMGVVVPVTKILLEDAHIDLSAYLGGHIARRFGQKEASWFVNGDGATQPEGVLTSTEVANNEIAAIDADALIDHFYAVKTGYAANGVWLMNRKTMALVRKLKDADGQYLWQPGLTVGQPANLLGRPVYEAVDMPDPTSGNTPIVFGDFATGYAVADRTGFEIIRDELTGAANGMVKFVARRRVGGRVVMGEALSKLSLAA
ncbi:phage major capsid protein [Phaeobacter inhibens]|uniref:phage major capsid protein n=1 Tax=Phaeobacter inhibens TaxID=221822 RepID=UPI0021A536D8|nr:phage major capsid protein [Phaeobacter inhibens]UWR82885.1 phage major capsid protein [Phaeobacter inhibens]